MLSLALLPPSNRMRRSDAIFSRQSIQQTESMLRPSRVDLVVVSGFEVFIAQPTACARSLTSIASRLSAARQSRSVRVAVSPVCSETTSPFYFVHIGHQSSITRCKFEGSGTSCLISTKMYNWCLNLNQPKATILCIEASTANYIVLILVRVGVLNLTWICVFAFFCFGWKRKGGASEKSVTGLLAGNGSRCETRR